VTVDIDAEGKIVLKFVEEKPPEPAAVADPAV